MQAITQALPWIQIVLSVILILGVLFQQSGAGIGGALGGSDSGGIYHTKRGFEKFAFYLTIVVGALFVISVLLAIVLK